MQVEYIQSGLATRIEEGPQNNRSRWVLDPARRAALFARLEGRGQVWMTATEEGLFAAIGPSASRFHVAGGAVAAA